MTTEPKTLSVPEAGKKYFDLGKNGSYEAAKRGEIPVIQIGSRLRVPIVAMERMLAEAAPSRAVEAAPSQKCAENPPLDMTACPTRQQVPRTSRVRSTSEPDLSRT